MSTQEKCEFSTPSDKQFFEQSMIYVSRVFLDVHPETPIDEICQLAQRHLDLFKSIYYALNKNTDAKNIENTTDEFSDIDELSKPPIKVLNQNDIIDSLQKLPKTKELKLRPSNPKRSPSKFSKDSFEYKQFVRYYSQKLRDKNISPMERSAKISDKWNSMNTEKVLQYLKKHGKNEDYV